MPRSKAPAPAAAGAVSKVPDDLIAVGKVVDAYGLAGWLKIAPYNVSQESVLVRARKWWVDTAPRGAPGLRPGHAGGNVSPPALQGLRVLKARAHGATVLAQVQGISSREEALSLKGHELSIARSSFPRSEEGEFYWVDLVGCTVINREGQTLGAVLAVDDHGAHALLEVGDGGGPPILIPFVAQHVDAVELAARRITVDWQADY